MKCNGSSYRSPLDTTTDSEAYLDGDEEHLVAQMDALFIEEEDIDRPTELRRFLTSSFLSLPIKYENFLSFLLNSTNKIKVEKCIQSSREFQVIYRF